MQYILQSRAVQIRPARQIHIEIDRRPACHSVLNIKRHQVLEQGRADLRFGTGSGSFDARRLSLLPCMRISIADCPDLLDLLGSQ